MTLSAMVELRCELILVVGITLVAAAILIAAAFAVMIVAYWRALREAHQGSEAPSVPVIEIFDSPMPTMMHSTPRSSPFMTHRKARRAGSRRVCAHRRCVTCCYNPCLPNECGYQCMLRASGMPPSKDNVAWLRNRVAERVEEARLSGERLGGMDVHEVMRAEEMSLKAYLAATKSSMWASQVELHAAAQILDTPVMYMSGRVSMNLGEGIPKFAIKKMQHHYVLARIHKLHGRVCKSPAPLRAGMHASWTWESTDSAVPSVQPTSYMGDPYTTVKVSEKIKTDVRRVTFLTGTMTVADLKARMSTILRLPVAGMVVLDDEDESELPDWTSLPPNVILTVLADEARVKMQIHVPCREATFHMDMPMNTQRTHLENKIGKLLQVSPRAMRITNSRGMDWRAFTTHDDHMITVQILERGGMITQISPTEPYVNEPYVNEENGNGVGTVPEDGDETSEEIRHQRLRDQVEGAHDGRRSNGSPDSRPSTRRRERSRSRSLSPTSSLRRGSASPTRHGHWASAQPATLHPAQAEPTPRPVIEFSGRPVGYVWANPDALALDVVRNARINLNVFSRMHYVPAEATMWRDAARITIEPRPVVPVTHYRDMRVDRWELFQRPRPVPILYGGVLEKYAIFPWALTLPCAQYRLDLWACTRHTYVIQAIDSENWVILKRDLPERFVQSLNALDDMARNILNRAGQRVSYAYAHVCDYIMKHEMDSGAVVADLVNDRQAWTAHRQCCVDHRRLAP